MSPAATFQTVKAMRLTSSKNHRAFMRSLSHAQSIQRAATGVAGCFYDMGSLHHCDAGFALLLKRIAIMSRGKISGAFPRRQATRAWMQAIGVLTGRGSARIRKEDMHPLSTIEENSDEALTRELTRLRGMLEQHGTLSSSTVHRFATVLSEVIHNSFVHGGSRARRKGVMLCGQNHRKAKHVIVAAMDWGSTIPGTLKACPNYAGLEKSDAEWIALAVQPGVTAGTIPTNAGTGLPLIIKIVTSVGGCLHVVSGAGVYTAEPKRAISADVPQNGRLDGTLIVAELR